MASRTQRSLVSLDETGCLALPSGCLFGAGVRLGDSVLLYVEDGALVIQRAEEETAASSGQGTDDREQTDVEFGVG